VTVTADRELNLEPLNIGGTAGTGKKLAELPLTITTVKEILAHGYSHSVGVANNGGNAHMVKVSFLDESANKVVVTPASLETGVKPGGSAVYPVAIKRMNPDAADIPHSYGITCGWGNETVKTSGTAYLARTQPGTAASFDTPLKYELKPSSSAANFSARLGFYREKEGLRILIKAADDSPVQTGTGDMASLRDGGDCVIIGIDNPELETGSAYGTGDFECGFATGKQAESYIWKGTFGYETAKPFSEAVKSVRRDGKYIYYDILIPTDLLPGFQNASEIGLGILIRNRQADGSTEELQFGDGFGKNTVVSRFGVLSLK
jgi:hypothetical protein